MAEWSLMTKRIRPSKFALVFDPGTEDECRVPFSLSEADLDDAIDYGRVERDDPFDVQLSRCAYHMVMELRVCDDERIFERPWVVVRSGSIIAWNHLAMGVTEADLE